MMCPYCNSNVVLCDEEVIYKKPVFGTMVYVCSQYPQCDAYVGCHKGTDKPKGRLANKELRMWKKNAHAVFDSLWKREGFHRSQAYVWLAHRLGIEPKDCHIGMFDVEMCKKVVKIVRSRNGEI